MPPADHFLPVQLPLCEGIYWRGEPVISRLEQIVRGGYTDVFFEQCVLEINLGSISIILYALSPLSVKTVLGKSEVFSQ